MEKLARKYRLGIARYFGEDYQTLFEVPVEAKEEEFFRRLSTLRNDQVNLLVMHVAQDTPEMEALIDMNDAGQHSETRPLVALHRSAELGVLLSPRFQDFAKKGNVKFVTYRDLARNPGLDRMKAP